METILNNCMNVNSALFVERIDADYAKSIVYNFLFAAYVNGREKSIKICSEYLWKFEHVFLFAIEVMHDTLFSTASVFVSGHNNRRE